MNSNGLLVAGRVCWSIAWHQPIRLHHPVRHGAASQQRDLREEPGGQLVAMAMAVAMWWLMPWWWLPLWWLMADGWLMIHGMLHFPKFGDNLEVYFKAMCQCQIFTKPGK